MDRRAVGFGPPQRAQPEASMRVWVYKVNAKRPGRLTGWHFDSYFRYRGRLPYDMGGDG